MGAKVVKITKKVNDEVLEGTCVESALPLWRDNGWTLVEEQKAESAKGSARGRRQPAPRNSRRAGRQKQTGDSNASAPSEED